MALPALPHGWAHLAGVSGGEKIYSWSIIIIKIYPALPATVGGQNGMDGSSCIWMTCSINRIRHQSRCLGIVLIVAALDTTFIYENPGLA